MKAKHIIDVRLSMLVVHYNILKKIYKNQYAMENCEIEQNDFIISKKIEQLIIIRWTNKTSREVR